MPTIASALDQINGTPHAHIARVPEKQPSSATTLSIEPSFRSAGLAATHGGGAGVRVLVTGSILLVGDVLAELVRRGQWAPSYTL